MADQTKSEGRVVTLDGTASSDPDGDLLTYSWSQVKRADGRVVGLEQPRPDVHSPPFGPGGAALVFQLEVTDTVAESTPAQVTVEVPQSRKPRMSAVEDSQLYDSTQQ